MKLDCLLDQCPKYKRPVDMRLCCGAGRGKAHCLFYGAALWSEMGEVTCLHSEAQHASPEERQVNREVFQALAPSVGHILYVGERR